tara:strand:- start:65 stop:1948 length:1884 start_codon:yes stop_codon:yes gene_type:complete
MKKLTLLFVFVQTLVFANNPVITLNGDSVVELYLNSHYDDPGATAFDAEDGDLSDSIVVTGTYDSSTVDSYVLAYSVTDSDGNQSVEIRTIRVVDNSIMSFDVTATHSFSNQGAIGVGDTVIIYVTVKNTGNTNLSVHHGDYILNDFNGNPLLLTSQGWHGDNYDISVGSSLTLESTYVLNQTTLDSGGLEFSINVYDYYWDNNQSIRIDKTSNLLSVSFSGSSDEIILDGQISANNNQIKKVADPTDNLDAVNKRYVDQRTLEQTIPGQNIGDLLYWNGQNWQKLSAPQEQSTLRFCEGQLTWGPCKATIEQSYEIEESQNSLTINTNINPNGSTIYSIAKAYYSTSPNIIYTDEFSLDINSGSWTLYPQFHLSKQNATTYFFQLYINSSEGEYYSEIFEYTTAPQDQNGNAIFSKTYGNQEWSTQSANVTTYRDGTPIPEVTDPGEWADLTTGAWCYPNNQDQGTGKLYNWYAVAGIDDNDPNTPTKELAPEGWHVPTDAEWSTLENYLIDNGYNYDGTTTGNKIAKAMAYDWGWSMDDSLGAVGTNQSSNNRSGFNAYPLGYRGYWEQGSFINIGNQALFWSSTSYNGVLAWYFRLSFNLEFSDLTADDPIWKQGGMQVRFVKD